MKDSEARHLEMSLPFISAGALVKQAEAVHDASAPKPSEASCLCLSSCPVPNAAGLDAKDQPCTRHGIY